MSECVTISESLPEGAGQLARALWKLSVLHAAQGRARESEEFKSRARVLKAKVLGGSNVENDESDEAYNRLNLWMLW